jgi:hypothetical protein
MAKSSTLEIVDTHGLTHADWAHINRVMRVYEAGGMSAFEEAIAELGDKEPVRAIRVLGAFWPDIVAEMVQDAMAERGVTRGDIDELVHNHGRATRKQ